MKPLISAKGISFSYPNGVTSITDISLDIYPGETVAIMGENGAGKTTLVKHFVGLLRPSKGVVEIEGADGRTTTVAEIARKVGYVFQNPLHQLFSETVEKEVRLGLTPLNLPKDEVEGRVSKILEDLDLDRYRERHPLMLSEGERKRVALASVLVIEPKALILDEPTLGQDPVEKRKLAELLGRLHREGHTVILVTHDVEFAFEVCDRILIMSKGRIIADGPRREIVTLRRIFDTASLTQPQIPRLAALLKRPELPEDTIAAEDAERKLIPLLTEARPR